MKHDHWMTNVVVSSLLIGQGIQWFLSGAYESHGVGRRVAVFAQIAIISMMMAYSIVEYRRARI